MSEPKESYPTTWQANGLWHFKKSKRSRTSLYRTKAHMLAEHPEITEAGGGGMSFAYEVKEPKRKISDVNTINLLRGKILAMTLERKEVGEACNRMENSWKAYAYENGRINTVLEKLCEHRHGKAMHSPDWLCDAIDAALMEIWGNTVGPENKPLLSGKKCGHGPEMLKVVDLYCAQCVAEPQP